MSQVHTFGYPIPGISCSFPNNYIVEKVNEIVIDKKLVANKPIKESDLYNVEEIESLMIILKGSYLSLDYSLEETTEHSFSGKDSTGSSLMEFIEDKESDIDLTFHRYQVQDGFRKLLKKILTNEEYDIICLKWGLIDGNVLTVSETKSIYEQKTGLSMTKDLIKWTENDAIRKIRANGSAKSFHVALEEILSK